MRLIIVTYAFLIVMSLSACSGAKGVIKQFDREGQEICLTVDVEIPSKFKIEAKSYHENKVGEAVYSLDDTFCDILIKSQGTIKVDDSYTLTLGHELMHCLYGDYHD